MSLWLGAPLGAHSLSTVVRVPQTAQGRPSSSGRGRLHVSNQSWGSSQTAGAQLVREQSPTSRVRPVRAVAAPERQTVRETVVPPSHSLPAGAANAILPIMVPDWRRENQDRRKALERLVQQQASEEEAAAAAAEAAAAETEATEGAARRRERLVLSAAASTSGRFQQLAAQPPAVQQQQPQQGVVASTRRGRGASRVRSAAPAAPVAPALRRASPPAAIAAAELASASHLRTWLLDCASRRVRSSQQPARAAAAPSSLPLPAATFPRPGSSTRSGATRAQRRSLRSRSPAQPMQLDAAAAEALSDEVKEDMLALINARLQLTKGRRVRSKKAGTTLSIGDTMSSYLRSLGNTLVLGRQQEAALASILQKGRQLEVVAARLAGVEESATSDGETLAAAVGGADLDRLAAAAGMRSAAEATQVLLNQREAKDLLMQYNVRLVISIAKRYCNNGIELEDLIPEGMVGLSKSLDRFEPAKGFRFSTYAHWWIRQAISRAVSDQSRVVRLPSHVCEILYRINRTVTSLMEQPDRDEPPSYEEVAAEVGLPVQRVIQYLRLAKVGGAGGERGAAFLSGSSLKEVSFADLQEQEGDDLGAEEEELESEERAACMLAVTDLMLGTLDKRERNILRMRYGLLNLRGAGEHGYGTGEPGSGLVLDAGESSGATMSLGEVAVAYGLSKERIRQIEDKAMRALRKPWRMQLVRELSFGGQPVTAANLSHYAAARRLAGEEAGMHLS